MRKKLGVDLDKACLSQQTVGTIFQKSFVPGNVHIGSEAKYIQVIGSVGGKIWKLSP